MNNSKFTHDYYDLIKKYKDFHEFGIGKLLPQDTFAGTSLSPWALILRELFQKNNYKSLIDFGCGKAGLYEKEIDLDGKKFQGLSKFWDCDDIYLYDPAVEKYSKYPDKKADVVICTDVLEHITPQDIDFFIDNLYMLAEKLLFVVVSVRAASKFFEDGRNIHLTIKPPEEWKKIFKRFNDKYKSINTIIHFN